MKKIVLTGGGTGGHVTPSLALLPTLISEGYKPYYIGSKNGIEKEIVSKCEIPYYGISTGKLRRYLDIKNFTDAFRILKGIKDSISIIREIKPDIIFSKGGFVSVPVVIAGKLCKIPIVIHESDLTPGLANKISMPLATSVCVAFPETLKNIENNKGILTGTPIRNELFQGNKIEGYKITGLSNDKPIILMIGGSQGSKKLNLYLRNSLNKLLKSYNVIHICGKGNLDNSLTNLMGYKQFEYVTNELPHIYAITNIVVSRAGANSIYEFLALKKPNLLIPLSKDVSRGDQILNAKSFFSQGFSKVIEEENLTEQILINEINDLFSSRYKYIDNMKNSKLKNGIKEVLSVIKNNTN